MYILDKERFLSSLKKRGYKSIGLLANALGIHRNTIHHYLSGNGVFPENFEKIIRALDLDPRDILIDKECEDKKNFTEAIASVVDKLTSEFRDVSFILFGSRARGTAQKYSDYDIGIFSSKGVRHDTYLKILGRKDDLVEDLPFFVDIVNLNNADNEFLKIISRDWMFLTGKLKDWNEIRRKAAS